MAISVAHHDRVVCVTIDRPERRNAVNGADAEALYRAFLAFDASAQSDVAVLTGAGNTFCAGADLHALAQGEQYHLDLSGDRGPMGPTRLRLRKPVIAAIEGHAVAGGLELALWCDLRVTARSAVLGVFNRRFGVPLVDLGTIRLPRIIGQGRALDLILTGRAVGAPEALAMGLVDRVVDDGTALDGALRLAAAISRFPQTALRNDRLSVLDQWSLDEPSAIRIEVERALATVSSGETAVGARGFASGEGRHGTRVTPRSDQND
jgi:enoyl-CoA hydratase